MQEKVPGVRRPASVLGPIAGRENASLGVDDRRGSRGAGLLLLMTTSAKGQGRKSESKGEGDQFHVYLDSGLVWLDWMHEKRTGSPVPPPRQSRWQDPTRRCRNEAANGSQTIPPENPYGNLNF